MNNLSIKLLFLILFILEEKSSANINDCPQSKELTLNDNKLLSTLYFPKRSYIKIYDLMSLNNQYTTTYSYLPWQETALIIIFETNALNKNFYSELSNALLANGYTVLLVKKFPNNIVSNNIIKDHNIKVISNIIHELKQIKNIEFLKPSNFQKVAVITNTISSKDNVVVSLDIYNFMNKISYIIDTDVELLIKFNLFKQKITLVNSNNKKIIKNNKELNKQIIYWCDFNLKKSIANTVKTTYGLWQEPFFIKLPNKPWPQIEFPFSTNHFVHCTQGNTSTWPHSHFYFRVLFSLDLASTFKSRPGQIYAGINGTAYVKNNCPERMNDSYTFNSSDCNLGFGNVIRIVNNKKDYYVLYAHLSEIYVKDKQYVNEGDLIGLEGISGAAGKRHLHLGLYKLTNIEQLITDIAPGIPFPFSFKARNFKTNQVEQLLSTDVLCFEQFDDLTILSK